MEHIAALMLLVACPEDLSSCSEIPAPEAYYQSMDECENALDPAMRRASQNHPQLYGQCAEIGPELAEADAEIIWDIASDGNLYVSVESATIRMASK